MGSREAVLEHAVFGPLPLVRADDEAWHNGHDEKVRRVREYHRHVRVVEPFRRAVERRKRAARTTSAPVTRTRPRETRAIGRRVRFRKRSRSPGRRTGGSDDPHPLPLAERGRA
jgi:hypothetical protein